MLRCQVRWVALRLCAVPAFILSRSGKFEVITVNSPGRRPCTNRCTGEAAPMHLGVAITVAALCLWQPQPRLPRAASRGHRRAAAPLLCADDASSDWRRRDVLRAAAASALTAGGLPAAFAAAAPPAETVRQIDALVWRQAGTGTAGATPGCSAASAGTAFGPKFVNYLSRFLLSYDIPSRRLWRARAAEIPIAWNKKQVSGGASSYLATTPTWLPR